MKGDFAPGISSISTNMLLWSAAVELLQQVEDLPQGATGALTFGDDGVILVENRRICWALASNMQKRLTDILCEQKDPPFPRADMEDVLKRCKRDGTPLGDVLVSSGIVSEAELRRALERHNCEAIVKLAQAHVTHPTRFSPHMKRGYDPRFVFSTTELLASLAGRRRARLATLARDQLASFKVPDASGFAFLRDVRSREPVVIAVDPTCELSVRDALELGAWAVGAFDVAAYVDPDTHIVLATRCARIAVISWCDQEVCYAALCRTRAASALLLRQLTQRTSRSASKEARIELPGGARP